MKLGALVRSTYNYFIVTGILHVLTVVEYSSVGFLRADNKAAYIIKSTYLANIKAQELAIRTTVCCYLQAAPR